MGTGKHADRMDVVLNSFQLMTEVLVDDYRAKFEQGGGDVLPIRKAVRA